MDWANVRKLYTPPSAKRYSPPPPTSMRCTKTISRPGMASYGKSLLTSLCVMEMCNSCFMDTKYIWTLGAMAVVSDTLFSELYFFNLCDATWIRRLP